MKNWTRNVDIFSKDFLVFPINQHAHWHVIIVCFPNCDEPKYVEVVDDDPRKIEDSTVKEKTLLANTNLNDLNLESDAASDNDDRSANSERRTCGAVCFGSALFNLGGQENVSFSK